MEIGTGKAEIRILEKGIGMMGWAVPDNTAEGSHTTLSARAFLVRGDGDPVALVCCEIALISLAVKEAAVQRLRIEHPELGLGDHNLMLMATHTHSAPGGFTHYPLYNITIPGFAASVLDAIVDAILAAIRDAAENMGRGTIRFGSGEFPPDQQVGFNRSPASYNRNPEVEKVDWDHRHLAIDRRMTLLRFDREDGSCAGAINFFGVHGTSVHSDNHLIHFDNKGYAAEILEAQGGARFVGAFAQSTTGDVTPNFRKHEGKKLVRGMYPDDDASARFNGELQAAKAAEILASLGAAAALGETIRAAHRYTDLSAVEVEPAYVDGRRGLATGAGAFGLAMAFGTDEGPGLPRQLFFLQHVVRFLRPLWRLLPCRGAVRESRREHDRTHVEKVTLLQTSRRRFLGIGNFRRLPFLASGSRELQLIRALDQSDVAEPKPWSPQILPAQLLVIGNVALAGLPQEITTTSGRRLRAALLEELAEIGVTDVVVVGYANGYAGYVTTPEEYSVQDYEGASTQFGKWTLPAWMTIFRKLAREVSGKAEVDSEGSELRPPVFSAADLDGRTYQSRSA